MKNDTVQYRYRVSDQTSVPEGYGDKVSGGGKPIEAIILAHGKYSAWRTRSGMGAEQHPKSFWGGAKELTELSLLESVACPIHWAGEKGGRI